MPLKLLDIIASLDVVYIDTQNGRRPVALCILNGVSKLLNATITSTGPPPHSDMVDYYMLSNKGNYIAVDDTCGIIAKVIPFRRLLPRRYCTSLGVNWYLPHHASDYRRYMPMMTHAAVLNCCLSMFKAILYRISKSHGWQLTPKFMKSIIHNHRLDVLKYIADRYQKFPVLENLHECIIACEIDIAAFIVAVPPPVIYKLTDLPDYKRTLSVIAKKSRIRYAVIDSVLYLYETLSLANRDNFVRVLRILRDNAFIDDTMIKYLARQVYKMTDDADLMAAIVNKYDGEPFTIQFNLAKYNHNDYIRGISQRCHIYLI